MSFAELRLGLTPEQHAIRRSGITATDAVILSGCSRWGHPLEVWEQKMGAPPKAATLPMVAGNAMEPVIMAMLAERYKLRVQQGQTVRHSVVPYFLATPDRFVHDQPIVLNADGTMPIGLNPEATCEGKLVGWHLVGEWIDEADPTGKTIVFPDSVAVQTCWQMGCTRTRRNYVGALLGGWSEDDYHHVAVDFNEDLWLGLYETCEKFWVDHVLTRRPPPPDASERAAEALGRIYPRIARPVFEAATDAESALMRRYLELNAALKALEEEKEQIGNYFRARIADTAGVRADEMKATWTEQRGRVSVEKLAAHYGLSETDLDEYRGEGSRVLRINKLSKKEISHVATVRRLAAAE